MRAPCPRGRSNSTHRSLQLGLRAWVERQTHHPLGYVEQLYTFADRDRGLGPISASSRSAISGLTRERHRRGADEATGWRTGTIICPGKTGASAFRR